MSKLSSKQRKHLRGLAHHYKPSVHVGQKGLTQNLLAALDNALETHELIKIKFVDIKDRRQKEELIEEMRKSCQGEVVGTIGHMAIFYRQHPDPQKRKVDVP